MHQKTYRYLAAPLSALFLLASTLVGACFFVDQLRASYPFIGSYDFPIFLQYAKMYITTGQLYIDNLVQYYPAAPIYKFPPLLASLLINLLQLGIDEASIYKACFYIQLSLYITMVFLGSFYVSRSTGITNQSNKRIFLGLSFLFAFTFVPFFETLVPLQMETYIVALLALALYCLLNKKVLLAGILISAVCALKIYPVLLLLYFILRRQWKAVAGFMLGISLITLYTIAVVGIDSHVFYFAKALPVMLDEYPSEALTNISLAANMRHFYDYYQPYFFMFDELPIKMLFRLQFLIFLLPLAWLVFSNKTTAQESTLTTKGQTIVMLEYALFIILILLGLIDSWHNYQLLLLIPVIIFLGVIFSGQKTDWLALTLLITSICVLFTTAYPAIREKIPASYIYQYVVYRGLTSYLIFYAGFRLLIRRKAADDNAR